MRSKTERVTMALSALSFGLLGWCVAHGTTWWLLSHQHLIDGATVTHRHSDLSEIAIVAASVAVATLMAMLLAPKQSRGRRSPASTGEMRGAVALTSGTYLAAEVGEFLFTDTHERPSPLVLAVGAVVYLLAGAGTAATWRGTTRVVDQLTDRLSAFIGMIGPVPAVSGISSSTFMRLRQMCWSWATSERGPPVAV